MQSSSGLSAKIFTVPADLVLSWKNPCENKVVADNSFAKADLHS